MSLAFRISNYRKNLAFFWKRAVKCSGTQSPAGSASALSRQARSEHLVAGGTLGYLCECGCGAECSEYAWRLSGSPRTVECFGCSELNRWRRVDLAPLAEAVDALAVRPWSTAAHILTLLIFSAAILTGWLGTAMGVAATILTTLPPGATH